MFLKTVKNSKFVVITWVFSSSKFTKIHIRPGLSALWALDLRASVPRAFGT